MYGSESTFMIILTWLLKDIPLDLWSDVVVSYDMCQLCCLNVYPLLHMHSVVLSKCISSLAHARQKGQVSGVACPTMLTST